MSVEMLVKLASGRERDPADHYPTPAELCRAAIDQLLPKDFKPQSVLDPGAGDGVWLRSAYERYDGFVRYTGLEIRPEVPQPEWVSEWLVGSYIAVPKPNFPKPNSDPKKYQRALDKYRQALWEYEQPFVSLNRWRGEVYDLVVGNPPYKFAEQFIRRSMHLLDGGGHLVFLLRLAFLEGQDRGDGLHKEFQPKEVAVCSKRPSFTGDGHTDATAYAVFLWQKGYTGNTKLSWLDW